MFYAGSYGNLLSAGRPGQLGDNVATTVAAMPKGESWVPAVQASSAAGARNKEAAFAAASSLGGAAIGGAATLGATALRSAADVGISGLNAYANTITAQSAISEGRRSSRKAGLGLLGGGLLALGGELLIKRPEYKQTPLPERTETSSGNLQQFMNLLTPAKGKAAAS